MGKNWFYSITCNVASVWAARSTRHTSFILRESRLSEKETTFSPFLSTTPRFSVQTLLPD